MPTLSVLFYKKRKTFPGTIWTDFFLDSIGRTDSQGCALCRGHWESKEDDGGDWLWPITVYIRLKVAKYFSILNKSGVLLERKKGKGMLSRQWHCPSNIHKYISVVLLLIAKICHLLCELQSSNSMSLSHCNSQSHHLGMERSKLPTDFHRVLNLYH